MIRVKHFLINRSVGSYYEPPDYDYHPACNAPIWYDGVYTENIKEVTCENCKRTWEYKACLEYEHSKKDKDD